MRISVLRPAAGGVAAVLCAQRLAADTIGSGFTEAPAAFPACACDMIGPDGLAWIADSSFPSIAADKEKP